MRIVVCYPQVNAYMAACWRELAGRPNVELYVIGFRSGIKGYPVAFNDDIMSGLQHRLLDENEANNEELVASLVQERKPDLIMISGWSDRSYRNLATRPELSSARMIMLMDNQRKGTWKQLAGKWALRKYLRRMDYLFVTGERAWQLARYFDVPESRIRRGCCGVDYRALGSLYERRATRADGWPAAFLYVGRYQRRKGVDLMLEGYSRYRKLVTDPWPLRCAGMGELESAVNTAEGVENFGFVQPARAAELYAEHAALVLFGRYDAWPLVLVEACAAGLPVVCSEACGSSVELIRPYHNGLTVPTGDTDALARALRWIHQNAARLPQMGARGHELASAYSAQLWADRVQAMVAELQ